MPVLFPPPQLHSRSYIFLSWRVAQAADVSPWLEPSGAPWVLCWRPCPLVCSPLSRALSSSSWFVVWSSHPSTTRDQHLALTYLFELIISFQHGTLCILKSLTISFISNANSHCFIVLYSQSPTLYLVSPHNPNALLVWKVRIRFICCVHTRTWVWPSSICVESLVRSYAFVIQCWVRQRQRLTDPGPCWPVCSAETERDSVLKNKLEK